MKDIPLQGNTSRFDYQSFDASSHRPYIAHLGDGTATVYDTNSGAVVGEIKGVAGVHGVLAVPELGRIYATATDKNQVAVIDASSLAVIGTTDAGDYPDGLAYDAEVGKIYVSDEHGGTDTVVDAQSMQVVFTGDAGKTPDVLAVDAALHRLYVAAESGPLTVFDYTDGNVRELVKADAGPNAHSVAVDPSTHHIYLPLQNVTGHPVLREMVVDS